MAEKKEMDLGSFVARLNHQIVRKAHTLYDRKKMNDVSMLNMWVADFLYDRKQEGKTVFQKDVEAEFGINRATASKMLALMEEKGLIRRTSLEADGRYKSIELEPEGLKLQKLGHQIHAEVEHCLSRSLTGEEAELFRVLCGKMIRSLEQDSDGLRKNEAERKYGK